MIEVVNRQRKTKIDLKKYRRFAEAAVGQISQEQHEATIAFVSDRHIKELNKQFRGIDKATDVLSFPAEETVGRNLGDIAISLERARFQAKEHGMSFDDEVSQLILHGLLHLFGYDHTSDAGEMNKLEIKLRKKLGI